MRRAMDATLPRINERLRAAGQSEIVPRAVDVGAVVAEGR